jgi:FkbM family methyltransferase
MLIPFGQLVKKYGLGVRGVLHVGAHMCEEQSAYEAEGVKEIVWLEANEALVNSQKQLGRDIHHILASDKDGVSVDFHISNNGQSSSMLELGLHKIYHPQVRYTSSVKMVTKRIDTLAKEKKWDMSRYNFVNLDVQGADLMALRGMDSLLCHFDFVYVEVNTDHVYVGCALLPEMDAFLSSHGFVRKELSMTDNKWGDAFYMRTSSSLSAPTASDSASTSQSSAKILLDIGAHRGLYADVHMSQFDKLVLVEANPDLVSVLRDKYKSNDKVVVLDKLVSDETKDVTFYSCNVDTISTAAPAWVHKSRFTDKGFEWTPRNNLPRITMDAIVKEYGRPSKTKIDVEGYEPHVIQSLTEHIGPLSFQWAEEVLEDIVACIYHLLKIGYTKFHIQDGDRYDFSPTPDQFISPDQIIDAINLWNPKRQDAWGMIHCL